MCECATDGAAHRTRSSGTEQRPAFSVNSATRSRFDETSPPVWSCSTASAARVAVNAEDAHLARGDELRASDVARAGPVIIDVDAIAVLIRDPLRDRGQVKRVKTGRDSSPEPARRQPNNGTITPLCDP